MRKSPSLSNCPVKGNLTRTVLLGLLLLTVSFGGMILPANVHVAHAATCTVTGTILQINPNPYVEHAFVHRVPLYPSKLKSIKAAYYVNGPIRINISVWTIWAGVAGQGNNHIDFWVFSRYRGAYPYIGNGTKTLVEYNC